MATSTKTTFLVSLDTDDKIKAQEILEEYFGMNLATYIRYRVKELIHNKPKNLMPQTLWRDPTPAEVKLFEQGRKDFEAGEIVGQDELMQLLDSKLNS